MSDDNAARFIRQHATTAKARCPDVPARVHPHMLRHSRAMHLYQAGMPLALLTEWLGHADPETTLIYAVSRELHQTGEGTADLRRLAA